MAYTPTTFTPGNRPTPPSQIDKPLGPGGFFQYGRMQGARDEPMHAPQPMLQGVPNYARQIRRPNGFIPGGNPANVGSDTGIRPQTPQSVDAIPFAQLQQFQQFQQQLQGTQPNAGNSSATALGLLAQGAPAQYPMQYPTQAPVFPAYNPNTNQANTFAQYPMQGPTQYPMQGPTQTTSQVGMGAGAAPTNAQQSGGIAALFK